MTTINSVNNGLTGQTGTGLFVGQTTPTLLQPIWTGQTGNTAVAAGNVGEVISSVVLNSAPVSFANNTVKDLTSISLTAGNWDIWGNFFAVLSVSCTNMNGWLSTTSATQPDVSQLSTLTLSGLGSSGMCVPGRTLLLSVTTTLYISCSIAFGSGTCNVSGGVFARRRA